MILVTGATGTSGVAIVRALLDLGNVPRVLARDPERAAKLLGDDVEIARGDFADAGSLAAACDGIDSALLLSPPEPSTVADQTRFVDAAKSAGVKHVVKFSAVGAHPGAPHRFGAWHGEAERYLERSGLAWTHLRPNFFMQNLLGFAGMVKGGTLYVPAGDGRAPFVDVRDIAAVAAHCLSEEGHEGKVYDVTGPEALSYADVAATFAKVLGKPVSYVDVPTEAATQSMVQAGMEPWRAEAINELNTAMKQWRFAGVTDVVKRVGHKDPTTLERFVRENVAAFG
ncbi:MAG TPA: SDR family oxidoreductase [Humisphaera sp.]